MFSEVAPDSPRWPTCPLGWFSSTWPAPRPQSSPALFITLGMLVYLHHLHLHHLHLLLLHQHLLPYLMTMLPGLYLKSGWSLRS